MKSKDVAAGSRSGFEDGEGSVVAEKLRKEFDGLVAVDDLDLSIRRGTLYGMIGPNGSGKTT
ncbi:MAG TPA: hypothetical protein HA364_07560, partial [Thermoplasmata archaeon]|nr:hypothetical protein [Thermoplasmata archaeon]